MRRARPEARWTVVAAPQGARATVVLTVLVLTGLTWLTWPVWGSLSSPTHEQAAADAPVVLAALLCGLLALGVATWLDSGRRPETLSLIGTLVALNTLARPLLNPSAGGIELVHALPLLAGMAAGAPVGFLVGAGSAIVSTITVGEPAATLPAQALVWGLSGMLGGLLRRLRPVAAWLLSIPLALVAGIGSGVLLNLMGWAQEAGTTLTSFAPGVPPLETATRLWAYTVETSLVLDLTRGLTTAVVLALVGLPLLVALRRLVGVDLAPVSVARRRPIPEEALTRREDRDRFIHLWNRGEQP